MGTRRLGAIWPCGCDVPLNFSRSSGFLRSLRFLGFLKLPLLNRWPTSHRGSPVGGVVERSFLSLCLSVSPSSSSPSLSLLGLPLQSSVLGSRPSNLVISFAPAAVELESGRLYRSAPTTTTTATAAPTTTKTTTGIFVGLVCVYARLSSSQGQYIVLAKSSTGDRALKHDRLLRYIDRVANRACRKVEVRPEQSLQFNGYKCVQGAVQSAGVGRWIGGRIGGLVDGWMAKWRTNGGMEGGICELFAASCELSAGGCRNRQSR